MLKLIEGKQYETIAGTFYFIGISRNDFTCDVCHKQHYDRKRQEYQNFYEFTDTNDGSFSQHYLIGTTCIRKFIKIQNSKLQIGKQYQYWYETPYNWVYDGVLNNLQHPQATCDCCKKVRSKLLQFHNSTNERDIMLIGVTCAKGEFKEITK
jgi:hypothetical protein